MYSKIHKIVIAALLITAFALLAVILVWAHSEKYSTTLTSYSVIIHGNHEALCPR